MKLSDLKDDEFEEIYFFLLGEKSNLTDEKREKYERSSAGNFLLKQLDNFSKWSGGMFITDDSIDGIRQVMKLKTKPKKD